MFSFVSQSQKYYPFAKVDSYLKSIFFNLQGFWWQSCT